MNRFPLLLLLIYSLVFTGLAFLNGTLLLLAIPILVYVAAGLLFRPQQLKLTFTRQFSVSHVSPGESVVVTLSVTNEGPSLENLYIKDLLPPALTVTDGQTEMLTTLAAGETTHLNFIVRGGRGAYRFGGVQAQASDYLNIFSLNETFSVPGQLLVLPEVIKLRQIDIRPRQTRVYSGLIPTRQGGPGVEFYGVREYQTGDPLRWINSRATARHQQSLFINEFQQERMADIGLILDSRQQSNVVTEQGSLFEYGVQATAALTATLLNANNRVGLFIYGNTLDWTYPGYGKIQRMRILWALARAAPSESQVFATLDHLPTRLFPARSQLIFVSPLLADDVELLIRLRARGYQLLIISPDPLTFEQAEFTTTESVRLAIRLAQVERTLMLGQLRQADIQVLDWDVAEPFEAAAQRALAPGVRL